MIVFGLGFVLVFVGIIIFIGSLIEIVKVRSFAACSESVTGRVGNKYVHHGNNRRTYSMDIIYMVEGEEFKRSVPASLSEYKTLEKDDLFEVRYKPDNPKKIIRVDTMSEDSSKKMRTLFAISVAMLVIGITLIVLQIIIVRL